MSEFIVEREQAGLRLDVYLTEHIEGSRSFIQGLIKEGHVQINGKSGKANMRLASGTEISVTIPEPESVEI